MRIFVSTIIVLGLLLSGFDYAGADEVKNPTWKSTGELGVTYTVDRNRNTGKDIWQFLANTRLSLARQNVSYSLTHKLNFDLGRQMDNNVKAITPDVVEWDTDWRCDRGLHRYRFVNLSVDTNSKFKNDLMSHLTGGMGYRLNRWWKLEPGFGAVKNLRPSMDLQGVFSAKLIYSQPLSATCTLSSTTEFITPFDSKKDKVGKSEWRLEQKINERFSTVLDYRIDFKDPSPVKKTWYKGRAYLAYRFL